MSDTSTDTTHQADKAGTTEGELSFSTFGSVIVNDNSKVTVPDDRAADFARAATYFSAHTNRHTLTAQLPDEPAAKLFARQASQWADDHHLSTSPKRNGNAVTFRFAAHRAPKSVDTDTVTVSKIADLPKPAKPTAPKPSDVKVPAQAKPGK